MNDFFLLAFLASGATCYGRIAAGMTQGYDCSSERWEGMPKWKSDALRKKHGDEGAKAVILANCDSLFRLSLAATGIFLAAGLVQLFTC